MGKHLLESGSSIAMIVKKSRGLLVTFLFLCMLFCSIPAVKAEVYTNIPTVILTKEKSDNASTLLKKMEKAFPTGWFWNYHSENDLKGKKQGKVVVNGVNYWVSEVACPGPSGGKTHANSSNRNICRSNHYHGYDIVGSGGWQCMGFARMVFSYLWDKVDTVIYYKNDHSLLQYLEPGDYVRRNGHSLIVLNCPREENGKVLYADCNNPSCDAQHACMISWNRSTTITALEKKMKEDPSNSYVVLSHPARTEYNPQEDIVGVKINEQNFPDENFRTYVKKHDIDKNGVLSEAEIDAVTGIDVEANGIKTLKGVEHFTSLKRLGCDNNGLSALDVSKNTALQELSCDFNNLTSLDISKNNALIYLYCNWNELTSLDISKNALLETLMCTGNQLTNLDVSENSSLHLLSCGNNQLTSLDISQNVHIDTVACFANQLTSLDVSRNSALSLLDCSSNNLKTLNISNNIALEALYCSNNELPSLDISRNIQLAHLQCDGNRLSEIDICKCPLLMSLVDKVQRDDLYDCYEWGLFNGEYYEAFLRIDKSIKLITDDIPEDKVAAYVTRCYEIILGRAPDAGGLNNWVNELNSGRKAAAEIIEQFVASAEFQNKNLSNADAVEILYKAMLGRGSDQAGKADWVAKLDAGQHLTAVINGFSGSAEFKAICDSYGINPGTVAVQENPGAANEKIKAYVERCYQIILGRGADEGGLNTWVNELNSGRKAAAEIIEQFVASAEFQNKKLSNSDSVEILYKAMLGRGSDPAGKASWVEKLDAGQDLTAVINGFCGSAEFKAICDSYGIQPGTVTVKQPTAPAVNDEKIRAFVARCYKIILGRDADEGGMNTWAGELSARRKAAAEIIEAFVSSAEFKGKNYSNPDAVEIMYKAMLGRGSDAAGKADWVGKLNAGQPLTAVINGFCGSAEFKAICDAYGITPGTVNVENVSKAAEETAKSVEQKTEKKANLVEITNASDTVNENLGTAVQAIYINEEKAKEFIGRCYRVILGREASQAELDSWIGQMMNGSKTADQIARSFLFSGEFKSRNIDNEELVKILYRVYMNREADAEGLATWTQKQEEVTGLNDLLNVFAKTGEFKAVVRDMAE